MQSCTITLQPHTLTKCCLVAEMADFVAPAAGGRSGNQLFKLTQTSAGSGGYRSSAKLIIITAPHLEGPGRRRSYETAEMDDVVMAT